jgi:DNA-binding CsgD family transcriptional regulator
LAAPAKDVRDSAPRPIGADGWHAIFNAAFRRSRNAMLLVDIHRTLVDVNPAFAKLLHRRRSTLIGRPLWELVHGGPLVTPEEWLELLRKDEFFGEAAMRLPDDSAVRVHFAAHPAIVTGTQLVLFVALGTSMAGRHFRRQLHEREGEGPRLSERELEIVRLIALGETGPEIADQLQISHNTVRTHVNNAMLKTGARSRAHLVAKALGDGLVLGRAA